ncbi:hypothetical protein [Effusibacillus pohliae]|uniref:hypothetical protein n=1 Tax=Effusibacillus pohliae TaxID=232270 RepID=UPI00036832AE|nr:hypothetical protein [Effusibacillus pohliae]
MAIQINMNIQNGDLYLQYLKINAVSNSAVVILGDSQTIRAESISTARGIPGPLITPVVAPALGGLGAITR